jgi:hypothetical protein
MSVNLNEMVLSDLYPYDFSEQHKAEIERTLNVLEWIPAINIGVGAIRLVYGITQIISGIVKANLCLLSDLFIRSNLGFGFRTSKHISYTIHGVGNVIRGALQVLFIGWLIFLIHDLIGIRYRYPVETTGLHYISQPLQHLRA